jgi:hypothetical protein
VTTPILPDHDDPSTIADTFNDAFLDKPIKLREALTQSLDLSDTLCSQDQPVFPISQLTEFLPISRAQVNYML